MGVSAFGVLLAAACVAGEGRASPIALVFETTPSYLQELTAALSPGTVEVFPCSGPLFCSDLTDDECARVVAVVGQPRDASILGKSCLSGLRLVQGTSYMFPRLSDVPAHFTVASYVPDWKQNGAEAIGEFVLAAVFHWAYRLNEVASLFTSCAWAPDAPASCPPKSALTQHRTLMNQTLGVLGYGTIGEAVARRAGALGMRVVATRQHGPFNPPPAPLTWISDDNDRLLREADFVVVTVPGTVIGLINRTALSLMQKSSVLIPVSATPVDFDALYEALALRQIGGAILDVWPHGCWHFPDVTCGPPYGPDAQPYAGGAIQRLDNVLALPGIAMQDAQFWSESAAFVASNLAALLSGSPLRGVVRNGTDVQKILA